MLTVAEGVVLGACVIDAHPAMRRNVIPTKVELMKLVLIVSEFLIGFYRGYFSSGEPRICHTDEEMPIGL
jgi:hypothetical protein